MKLCSRSRAVCGFTLVELLVVIAIIGILASIMFPVFASARDASKKTVCQSNLRQLYIAFQLYAKDWDDTLPCPGGQKDEIAWSMDEGGGVDAYLHNQNMGGKSVYCCPSYAGRWNSKYSPRTYGMNSFLREPPDILYPYSLDYLTGISQTHIIAPADTILLYEGIPANSTHPLGEGYVYRCADWQWVRGFYPYVHYQNADEPWHGQMNNYLMCDGHIITKVPEKYGSFIEPTLDNNMWYAQKLR